jgi:hypothetical protein
VYHTVPIICTSCYRSLLNALPIWLAAMVTHAVLLTVETSQQWGQPLTFSYCTYLYDCRWLKPISVGSLQRPFQNAEIRWFRIRILWFLGSVLTVDFYMYDLYLILQWSDQQCFWMNNTCAILFNGRYTISYYSASHKFILKLVDDK